MKDFLSRHKYKLVITLILVIASLISTGMAWARMAYSSSSDYATMIWNLGLAWIPYIFSLLAYTISWSKKRLFLVVPGVALIWLIFFPNAPYILTDFQHLTYTYSDAPLWYDVIMLVWFAWTGLLLGVVSLHFMQEIVTRAFGRISGWLFTIGVTVLSSVGIFLGRFNRWNSWDLFNDPLHIAHDIWDWLKNPLDHLRVYGFIALFTLLFLFVYLAIHAFGRIMQERRSVQGK